MKTVLLALGLALAARGGLAMSGPSCIPLGKSATIAVNLPGFGSGSGSGLPNSGQWVSGTGTAWDADFWTPPDNLGTPTEVGSMLQIVVQNNGGNLYDQNGNKIEGPAEGPCIEVFFEMDYTADVTMQGCLEIKSGGVGTSFCYEYEGSITSTWTSPVGKFCPC